MKCVNVEGKSMQTMHIVYLIERKLMIYFQRLPPSIIFSAGCTSVCKKEFTKYDTKYLV